jgi:predicted Zn-dependent peptidase
LTGLAQSKDSPDAISQRLTSALVYGKNHPYGEVATEATIGNVTVADVVSFVTAVSAPVAVIVYATGPNLVVLSPLTPHQ